MTQLSVLISGILLLIVYVTGLEMAFQIQDTVLL